MKHLSTLVICLGMFWTWQLARSEAPVNVRTHYDIQTDLSHIIETTIKAQVPQASDLRFTELYTETIDSETVKATFRYTYNADEKKTETKTSTQTGIAGTAIVARDSANPQNWILKNIDVAESSVEFRKGTIITKTGEFIPEGDDDEGPSHETGEAEPKAE